MSVLSVDEDESLMSDADISESCGTRGHTQAHIHNRSRQEQHGTTIQTMKNNNTQNVPAEQ